MVFSYPITTPKNTPFETPLKTIVDIGRGIIHKWIIFFPPGALGEHRLRINRGSDFILPVSGSGYILPTKLPFQGDDFVPIISPPYQLTIYSWNLDTVNDHTVYIWIFQKPAWTFTPYSEQLQSIIDNESLFGVF